MTRSIAFVVAVFSVLMLVSKGLAMGPQSLVEATSEPGAFPIVASGAAANLYVDSGDFPGVARAAGDLQADIQRVTGLSAQIVHDESSLAGHVVIIGALGKSRLVDELVRQGKLDASPIAGKWESFILQVVPNPMPGVAAALVIAGSDKRGAIYGIYELSEQIGVSPWSWWADVPIKHRDALFFKQGRYVQPPPVVKYRGIFLNDEAPELTGWANEEFGGYNHKFYERIFELVLRLKANYLWPAMWNNCFNEDDPLNPKLADEYGIVMGTSHVEPMMRADKEWNRAGFTARQWNYATHAAQLQAFWDQGIQRNKDYESIITLAMRGKIDTPMTGSADMAANIALLEKIVADQREIIARRMNPDVTKVPQLWALYKEVQEYYEDGMRVPDDVTLLWCDDNWGNIRRLPTPAERNRAGGAGVYYHFDYVGGPRNYKWVNTSPIAKIWEQMSLAHTYGADRIWIVNVGHLKGYEFPTQFFLDMAWDPERYSSQSIMDYTRQWCAQQFGPTHAGEIADLIAAYTKYNGRCKPELLDPTTFSLINYREADKVLADFAALNERIQQVKSKLPADAQPAFFELVEYPATSYATVAKLHITVARNRLYAAQGRAGTNDLAAAARALFKADQDLSDYYNHTFLDGKWSHIADQTHIGYTSWQQPRKNVMPKVVEIKLPQQASMGVSVEGSPLAWPRADAKAVLPEINAFNRQSRFIDVFNRGQTPFDFTATASEPWITLSQARGTVDKESRLTVDVDWTKAPKGNSAANVTIASPGADPIDVAVTIANPADPTPQNLDGFVETDGCVSIEAEHYTRKVESPSARWGLIEDYGRTLSAMTIFPSTAASVTPPVDSPCLEYKMYLFDAGDVKVSALIGPTQAFVPGRGLRLAFSFDDQPPRTIDALEHNAQRDWERTVKESIRVVKATLKVSTPGYHVLKIWMVDPAVVLEKIVVDLGGQKPSFLGPPESYHRIAASAAE